MPDPGTPTASVQPAGTSASAPRASAAGNMQPPAAAAAALPWTDDPAWLAPAKVDREDTPGGSFVLRSPEPLGPPVRCVGEWLEHWSRVTPEALFIAEREAARHDPGRRFGDRPNMNGGKSETNAASIASSRSGEWRTLSYKNARQAVGAIAQWLIDARLPLGEPVVIVSGNSIEHALMALAALHIGRPVCSLPTRYSRRDGEHAELARLIALLDPALVYASDADAFGPALQACQPSFATVFGTGSKQYPGSIDFASLTAGSETSDVQLAFTAVRPAHSARLVLTTGAPGRRKFVVNTQQMLCASQRMLGQQWRFLEREAPIMIDAFPWAQALGGNVSFNLVLAHGGSLHIDGGLLETGSLVHAIRTLQEVKPTLYFDTPSNFEALTSAMERDEPLRACVFDRLRVIGSSHSLSESTRMRLQRSCTGARLDPLLIASVWGPAEASAFATGVHWAGAGPGCIGLPPPGVEIKLAPVGSQMELRVRGPSVFTTYLGAPESTAFAFDSDGYYATGEAASLIDADRPEMGVAHEGRITTALHS